MKIRSSFVSNSSSASYVIIGKGKFVLPTISSNKLSVPEDFGGCLEFGWEPDDLTDFGSRLNFAYLQTLYATRQFWPKESERDAKTQGKKFLGMLEKVLKENLKISEIRWNLTDSYNSGSDMYGAWIDHQSSAMEGQNLEIFDSEEILKCFLFAKGSYIHLDNDNK